ncbi:DODA-type extradiol aromatic ring-opening family dioxygenase [Mesoterricola silvestris]|uniref:Dioxygenase n=1 Tax=Mesoterricola silvestris TaxID=2927979 RepID=A0AA48GN50_9BACT|nr:class III extradiol ring-cleavage dioxygenase [Mesoterricola silvestris]BDU74472.1 dioxygenase [Mesoterricola silvestris]
MRTQPVLFVSHGSPMLALGDSPYARSLAAFAAALPERPRAVLVVSAHWQTAGPRVASAARPGVLHDFGGFPRELYALDYPAPGDPALALRAAAVLGAEPDPLRPLDHGAWAVLRHLFPGAEVPVVQVSLPRASPADLVAMGRALRAFREEGVLILASGGLVHNLGRVAWSAPDGQAEAWALEAESWFLERIVDGRLEELLDHRDAWPQSHGAAPTTEHLDPVFVALGAAEGPARTVFDGWQLGSMSLRSLAWG